MSLVRSRSAVRHRQFMVLGWRAQLAREGAQLPVPRSPRYGILTPGEAVLLVLVPPAGLFVWWRRRYRPRVP